jgi:uncharacterized protein
VSSQQEKAFIEEKFGKVERNIKFCGFGGNHEVRHVGIENMLINQMERFSFFKGRNLNAYVTMIQSYSGMLNVFQSLNNNLAGRKLSVLELAELLQPRIHSGSKMHEHNFDK